MQQTAAGGGLLRDHHGELLTSYCLPLQASSRFEAELRSLLQGLLLLPQTASHVWIELDAAAVVTVITSGARGSGQLREVFSRLRLILRDRHVRVTHIHREGNRPADFLARLGHEVDDLHTFDVQTAPRPLASLVRMDQLGYPNFRFRR
ncbi:hypothetical protein C2S51_015714 [Perilla frutescens var. frutescens]|nr:hypothetical protein C2S51_015714 [Perilla frutescens var. frutescens]